MMDKYYVGSTVIKWMEVCQTGRTQVVKYCDELSSLKNIIGVPQMTVYSIEN